MDVVAAFLENLVYVKTMQIYFVLIHKRESGSKLRSLEAGEKPIMLGGRPVTV